MANVTQEIGQTMEEYNQSREFRAEWDQLQKKDYFLKELVENFEEKDRFVEAELKNLKVRMLIFNEKFARRRERKTESLSDFMITG